VGGQLGVDGLRGERAGVAVTVSVEMVGDGEGRTYRKSRRMPRENMVTANA
jgi:hypothetical protein